MRMAAKALKHWKRPKVPDADLKDAISGDQALFLKNSLDRPWAVLGCSVDLAGPLSSITPKQSATAPSVRPLSQFLEHPSMCGAKQPNLLFAARSVPNCEEREKS